MKRILLILPLLCLLSGCEPMASNPDVFEVSNGSGFHAYRIRIDGCEYLSYDRSLTHKGNCTNSIHSLRTPEKP